MTLTTTRKSWAGANLRHMVGARSSTSAYISSEDEQLLANLASQAWREDPTPLGVETRTKRRLE